MVLEHIVIVALGGIMASFKHKNNLKLELFASELMTQRLVGLLGQLAKKPKTLISKPYTSLCNPVYRLEMENTISGDLSL